MIASRPFIANERVRWADVDLVGIMRFSAFARLVEYAEQELWREAGMPYSEVFQRRDVWLPRRNLAIEYLAPAYIDEDLRLLTYVSRMGTTALTLNVDVLSADLRRLLAAATMVTVCVGAGDFRKQPLPDEVRQKLAPFRLGVDEARAAVRDRHAMVG